MTFAISLAVVLLFVLWGFFSPSQLTETATNVLHATTSNFGWFYLLVTFFFLVFCIFLAFSKYGQIRLGDDDDEPEYSAVTWFSMLFSAGMGIGLVFWGVAEPVSHYFSPPVGVEAETSEAARTAMRYAFFHWGLHPWGIYAVIALSLAYFQYRKGAKGLISSTFYPLLGDRVNGPIGKLIDILAVIATAFGVATSLGLGTLQINGGLSHLFQIPSNITVQITIIAVITVLYLWSATSGLDRGIKILSNTNLVLALALLLLTLIFGPTAFLFDNFTNTLGSYLQNLVSMSMRLMPFTESNWIANWTLFYWAWWIAWAPFVGTFIARVSKGRTIKEFIIGVLLVPTVLSFIWFSVFGGTALHLEIYEHAPIGDAVKQDVSSALFITLEQLPMGMILSVVATLLIIIFFITSADSATFVLGMLSSGGKLDPPNPVKITWGILQSSTAVVLLLSGGLEGLQTASIVAALPFAVILTLMCFSLLRALQEEDRAMRKKRREQEKKLRRLLEQL
ncbi:MULTISPECIES: glycine betaine uptake BCCT transporter [Brevibacillus]|jgi:glycine betaine transporter|uniref:glycine betaine uptake BCCT transporter n=1 Tax=Brevibacillus TaxID=55080 RepID=UPI0004684B75|nr:BCCT family transporter [Brevibacillus borstelensis]MBE5397607.1 BCCT family transporter [Brevibacillus borstelensis]MCM3558805.1 BCCT family transporter [Brevibacillus borstelensis]MCM3621956.1 BCCT family transporter [Brevibacillus borstelensis]MED1744123.1 BCCT family transporter [Brevibacillus borstelensis]MED1850704.1 BCCT family transporter [Brevibacillus borstelensis]